MCRKFIDIIFLCMLHTYVIIRSCIIITTTITTIIVTITIAIAITITMKNPRHRHRRRRMYYYRFDGILLIGVSCEQICGHDE